MVGRPRRRRQAASETLEGSSQEVDFGRIGKSAQENGGITLLGPPPFNLS